MEAYTTAMQQALELQVAALPEEELKLLLRYYHLRKGPGQQIVEAEALKRNLIFSPLTSTP